MTEKRSFVIGADIGGTYLRIGGVDQDNRLVCFQKVPVGEVFSSGDALLDLKNYLLKYIRQPEFEGEIKAIGMGFPATLNRERTVVVQAPNIPYMENLPITDYLQKELSFPVFSEKDVNLTLLYDKDYYRISDEGILVGCYFGTGIGNAILINGRLLKGKDGAAGELGHMKVWGSEEPCGCGNKGCLENLAGGKYLAKLCREQYSGTPIEQIFEKHGKEPLLQEFVKRMAIAVSSEINILNPDHVILGGGVLAMKDFPVSYLTEKIYEYTRKPYPAASLSLIFSKEEKTKTVSGAASYARRQISE